MQDCWIGRCRFENSKEFERDLRVRIRKERLNPTRENSACIYQQAAMFHAIRCRIRVSFIDARRFSEIAR